MSTRRRPNRPGAPASGPGRGHARRRPPATARRRSDRSGVQAQRVRIRNGGRLSKRAAALALVLSILALAYAYPLRTFVEQRIEINRLQDSQSEQRERIDSLEAEREQWDDPEYVASQIRSRLMLVKPGEELIIVIDEDDPTSTGPSGSDDEDEYRPWYEDMKDIFEDADQFGTDDVDTQ
ncbi:FtsB family cell division protein [Natronoglycomyces albus]|uniref:Septum formation initiator family protein n=1 Tax=Natronoglycomyces albus TaxID=2811108 RepID=A0A895XL98_9ACTN|nr:septum formation initiator family protein [Natronoglycomyces albus]QSB04572.1 septum formation initiator family protein [Natronoglycomyces albus]